MGAGAKKKKKRSQPTKKHRVSTWKQPRTMGGGEGKEKIIGVNRT